MQDCWFGCGVIWFCFLVSLVYNFGLVHWQDSQWFGLVHYLDWLFRLIWLVGWTRWLIQFELINFLYWVIDSV
jgi:hypothetical protein